MAAGISQHPSACCQHFTDGLMCPGVRLQHPRVASPQQPLPPQPEFTQKALLSSHLAAASLSHSWVTSVPAAPTPLLPLHPVLFSPLEKIPLFGNLAIWGQSPLTDPITWLDPGCPGVWRTPHHRTQTKNGIAAPDGSEAAHRAHARAGQECSASPQGLILDSFP